MAETKKAPPDDGGFAFPLGRETEGWWERGMSLRDWFAGQALSRAVEESRGLPEWGLNALFGKEASGIRREEIVAALAYRYADAMLAKRKP